MDGDWREGDGRHGLSREVTVGIAVVAVTTLVLAARWWLMQRRKSQQQAQQQQSESESGESRGSDSGAGKGVGRERPRRVPQLPSQESGDAQEQGEEEEEEAGNGRGAEQPQRGEPPTTSQMEARSQLKSAAAQKQPQSVHFIQPSSHPAFTPECGPIKTLDDLLAFREGSEFCRARIPLQTRCMTPKGPRLLVCHDMMGGYKQDHRPQGTDDADIFMLQHWHLMDTFVYFAHELVSLPPPAWTNVAHLHGVNVLGTFITEWDKGQRTCKALLQDEATRQLAAEKLALIMTFHRFDGWLINIENEVEDIGALKDFVQRVRVECHKQAPAAVVLWYDAVTTEGRLQWQDELNRRNAPFYSASDGIFLNYTWTPSHLHRSLATATAMRTTPTGTTGAGGRARTAGAANHRRAKGPLDVYAGIDVFGRNTYGGGKMLCSKAVDAIKDANLSIALFAPGWTYECRPADSPFLNHNLRFWSQLESRLTPRRVGPTAVFATHLTLPRGAAFFIAGRRVTGSWSDIAMQDTLPSHSMTPSGTNPFPLPPAKPNAFQNARAELEERVSFCGGSCLRLSCTTGADWKHGDGAVFRLFHTNVALNRPLVVGLTLGTTNMNSLPSDACLQFVLSREDRGAVQYLRFPTCSRDQQNAFRFRDAAAATKLEARFGLTASQYARKGDGTLAFAPISLLGGGDGGDKEEQEGEVAKQGQGGGGDGGERREDGPSEKRQETQDHTPDGRRWQRDLYLPPSIVQGDNAAATDDDGSVRWHTTWFVVAERDISHQTATEMRLILHPRAAGTTTRVLLGGIYVLPPSLLNKCCARVHGLRVSHVDWHDINRESGSASLHLTLSWADADAQTIRYYRVFAAAGADGTDNDFPRPVYLGTGHVPCFRVCGIDPRNPSRPTSNITSKSSNSSSSHRKGREGVVRFWVQPVGYAGLYPRINACAHVDVKWAARR